MNKLWLFPYIIYLYNHHHFIFIYTLRGYCTSCPKSTLNLMLFLHSQDNLLQDFNKDNNNNIHNIHRAQNAKVSRTHILFFSKICWWFSERTQNLLILSRRCCTPMNKLWPFPNFIHLYSYHISLLCLRC